ncbi:MAG: glycosyltransferase [Pseudobutyrivibrio sp.]|nr:glycosyltransferase [Pseudobutyrivibrio sp.]
MSKVAIIMSTYNGTKYLNQQIDSILNQSHQDFTLFIRDDGSQDDTLTYLQKATTKDYRIKLVVDEPGKRNENLGFGASFALCMKSAMAQGRFDYFAFCDQDDCWEEDKLKAAVAALDKEDKNRPCLYACNYFICDENLHEFDKFATASPMKGVTFQNLFFEGVFPGFTMVINKTLAQLGFENTPIGHIYYHDKWVSLIAMGLDGKVIFDKTPLARYRRHNQAASSTNLGAIAKLRWRIDTVLNGDYCPRTNQMLDSFKEFFYKDCDYDTKDFLDLFTSGAKLRKIFYPHRLRRSFSGELLLRLIILLGRI